MNFFICNKCGCIDDDLMSAGSYFDECTECNTGEWHHFFEKERYDEFIHHNLNIRNKPDDLFSDLNPSFG